MRASIFALAGLVLLSSGCFGSPGETRPPTGSPNPTGPPPLLEIAADRPEWVLGQSWTYRIEIPGQPTTVFQMMVAEDLDDLWIVGTSDRPQALHHALYSTNPVLGRIVKSTLSPYQSGQRVEMFQFPLKDGKTWTANFFGEPMTFTATYRDDLPGTDAIRVLEGFQVRAVGASGAHVEFNYAEAAEWFTDFQVYDRNGTKIFHLILTDFGAGYRGPYHFLRGQNILVERATETTFERSRSVPKADKLGLGLIASGSSEASNVANLTLSRPDGSLAFARTWTLGAQAQDLAQLELASVEGVWKLESKILVGKPVLEIRFVSLAVTEGAMS